MTLIDLMERLGLHNLVYGLNPRGVYGGLVFGSCESALKRDPAEISSQLVAVMLFFFTWLGSLSAPTMTPLRIARKQAIPVRWSPNSMGSRFKVDSQFDIRVTFCVMVFPERFSLTIDDDLLEKAEAFTQIKERRALIREALHGLIERESARRLAQLGGTHPELKVSLRRRSSTPGTRAICEKAMMPLCRPCSWKLERPFCRSRAAAKPSPSRCRNQ